MSDKGQQQTQTTEMTPEELKKKKRKKIIIAICILLIIIAAIVIYFLTRPKGITEGNYKQIMEEMDEKVQEGYFETYMNTEWTFPDGTSETTNAILGNSPNNKKPIRCEVRLADTDEVIFKTDVMPVEWNCRHLSWVKIWMQVHMMQCARFICWMRRRMELIRIIATQGLM